MQIQAYTCIPGRGLKKQSHTKQLNNSNWANGKVETKLYLLPIGPNKIV